MGISKADISVDLGALAAWMDGQSLGKGPIKHAQLLAGGTQNILVRFRRSGRDFVLRRPPPSMCSNSLAIRQF